MTSVPEWLLNTEKRCWRQHQEPIGSMWLIKILMPKCWQTREETYFLSIGCTGHCLATGPHFSRRKTLGTFPVNWDRWQGRKTWRQEADYHPSSIHLPGEGPCQESAGRAGANTQQCLRPSGFPLNDWGRGHQKKWYLMTLSPHIPRMICSSYYWELPEGSRHLGEMACSILRGKKRK